MKNFIVFNNHNVGTGIPEQIPYTENQLTRSEYVTYNGCRTFIRNAKPGDFYMYDLRVYWSILCVNAIFGREDKAAKVV